MLPTLTTLNISGNWNGVAEGSKWMQNNDLWDGDRDVNTYFLGMSVSDSMCCPRAESL